MIKKGEALSFFTEGKRSTCTVEKISKDKKFFSVVEKEDALHIGKPIKMSINRYNGIEKGEGTVIKQRPYRKEGTWHDDPSGLIEYLIKITTPFSITQKRKFFRFECEVPAVLSEINEPTLHESTIIDISVGGAKICTNNCFRVNKLINIMTSLENRNLHLLGVVLGADSINSSGSKYQYTIRVRFTDVSPCEEDLITRFIFTESRKTSHKK